ncbi:MAG TPA: TonB-dependent receptor [Candidatus Angelobacter sp.]|nr:TonB-dependent receptor [Candidatus Angelobacter sp.]
MPHRFIGFIGMLAVFVFAPTYLHASVFGTVKAIVHDPQHRPVQNAKVVVQSRTSSFHQDGTTNDEGIATILNVPVGEYDVTVESRGFSKQQQATTVASGNIEELHFALAVGQVEQTLEVSGAPETIHPTSSTPQTLVSREQIAETPGADRTNSLSVITDFVPGAYMVHDQLHVRGGHQVTWAIDGVAVPNTNIASNVGPQFSPKDMDYLEAQRGGYSAEFGDRTYGVFNVVPRSGFERNRQAELVTSYGTYNSTDDQLSFGDHNDRGAYYFSVNGNRSDYGLAPPTSKVLHDQVAGGGAFTSLILNVNPNNQLRFVGAARADYYQVPNSPDDQANGIRDREREQDVFANFTWVHTFGPGVVFTASPFFHSNRAAFEGGPQDVPSATDNRFSIYGGAETSLAVVKGRHNFKAGFSGFAQHDTTLFAVVANDGSGQSLSQTEREGGSLAAVYVEDQYKATSWLTVNAGMRFTHFSGTLDENVGSPRLGLAIQIPRLKWVLRGTYSRFYQAPPLSTVSGPLLDLAISQGIAFLPLRGERDEQHEAGLTIPVRGWAFDFDYFRTGAHNFFDHNVLANSNIFFPITIQGARIVGYEASVRSPKLFHRGDVHLAYSRQTAQGMSAVTGGLTDFSPPPDGSFFLDHDQRHTLSTGFQMNALWKTWVSGNFVYGSGFLSQNGPAHLPSSHVFDLSVGRSFGENWSAKLTATNFTNKQYFIDVSNTFGGSHFGDPRMISLQLRYRFHY